MKQVLPIFSFILISLNLCLAQNTMGTTSISKNAYNGFTLITAHNETYLINNCGQVINQWTSSFPPGNAVYLREDGSILRAGRTNSSDITFGGQGGVVEIFDWDGNLTWQFFYDNPQMRQHHDVYPMPNGNVLILAATVMTNTEAIQAGRNPTLLSQSVLFNEQIIEVEPMPSNQGNIIWEWNINDHLVQDFDNTKDNYGDVSLNPNKMDINFVNGGTGGANWLHINSIQYNEALDQIIVSSRNLSEIFIIDHSTTTLEAATSSGGTYGQGGDLLYRWGNPQSYRQGAEADRQLYGQHYPHIIPENLTDEGKIILYNNGNGRDPEFSEVFIITPPQTSPGFYTYTTNTSYGPVSPEYIYEDPNDQTNFFSHILSSAQRLPNGNTLICEGNFGHIFEIDSNENIVWDYISPISNNTGTIGVQGSSPPSGNVLFRAIKYSLDYPAFTGRDLTPSQTIESNSNITDCLVTLNNNTFNKINLSIFPNPTKNTITLNTLASIEKVELYNINGAKILELYHTKKIDVEHLSTGIYFIKAYSNNNTFQEKIIKY